MLFDLLYFLLYIPFPFFLVFLSMFFYTFFSFSTTGTYAQGGQGLYLSQAPLYPQYLMYGWYSVHIS